MAFLTIELYDKLILLAQKNILITSTLLLSACWLCWHVWTFQITPFLRPDEPKKLPYWIPFLGSAIDFGKNSHDVINRGRNMSSTREPFAVTIAGEIFYMLTDAKDIVECQKNLKTLSFDLFVRDLMSACGSSASCVDKMCQEPPPYLDRTTTTDLNPKSKSIAKLAVDFHHNQLLPGVSTNLDQLNRSLTNFISRVSVWDSMKVNTSYVLKENPDSIDVSLVRWCGKVLVEAATVAYFGPKFLEIEPDFLSSFYRFDAKMWQILFRLPRFLSKDVYAAKDEIASVMSKYYRLPPSERPDQNWFTHSLEVEQRKLGLSEDDMAATMLIIYFGLNANIYKLSFWTLAYLLHDSELLRSIVEEINEFKRDDGEEPDMRPFVEGCPRLNALLDEVLRLHSNFSSVRFILEDTIIAGKTLKKGNKIMMPFRQLHENPEVYGSDSLSFDGERFLKNKNLKRSTSFRPFGWGATYCPGRFAARHEVVSFIVIVLQRFDVALVGKPDGVNRQRFPRMEGTKPSFGMMGPLIGEDLVVRVKPLVR